MAHDHSAMSDISDEYNHHSSSGFMGHVVKHVAIMGLFMAFPMVAAAVPIEGATALDLVVQTGHAMLEMVEGVIDYGFPVLESVFENAMEGNFAPSTWDAGSMHGASAVHMMPGGALMSNVPGADLSALGVGAGAQIFSTPMEWFQSLPAVNQARFIEDAQAFGVPFEQYITDWCNNNHMSFAPSFSPR